MVQEQEMIGDTFLKDAEIAKTGGIRPFYVILRRTISTEPFHPASRLTIQNMRNSHIYMGQ